MNNRRNLAIHFQNVFERLLAREKLDLYGEDMSFIFEIIAPNLYTLNESSERKAFTLMV